MRVKETAKKRAIATITFIKEGAKNLVGSKSPFTFLGEYVTWGDVILTLPKWQDEMDESYLTTPRAVVENARQGDVAAIGTLRTGYLASQYLPSDSFVATDTLMAHTNDELEFYATYAMPSTGERILDRAPDAVELYDYD